MLNHLILGWSALLRASAGPRVDRPEFVARYRWDDPLRQEAQTAKTTPTLRVVHSRDADETA